MNHLFLILDVVIAFGVAYLLHAHAEGKYPFKDKDKS